MSTNPLDQFRIKTITEIDFAGRDLSFTNSSLFMVIAVAVISGFMFFAVKNRSLIPGRMQSVAEVLYEFVAAVLKDIVGEEGRKFFPFVFTLFSFVLVCNLLGMIPGAFTVTSHFSVTFALAMFIFVGVTLVAIFKKGPIGFLKFFVPSGIPMVMAPFMVLIEIVAYFVRPISLSIRLGANMMVGHMILKIVAGFVLGMGLLGGWLPLGFMALFTGFEFFIAMLQAYIFTILTCVYLNDALHGH